MDVKNRGKEEKAKDLLASGFIPIEFYGKGMENKSLKVDYQDFRKLFRVAGSNTVITLNVDDGKEKVDSIVHDVAYHPVTDKIVHVDFVKIKMDEVIHTEIPVELVGTSPAEKDLGGTLMQNLNEVEVKCLPGDLIQKIEVNVEVIEDFNSFVRIKDLDLPETLEIMNDPEEVIVTAVPPAEEEEEEVPEVEGEEGVAEGEGEAEKEGEEFADEGEGEEKEGS